MDSVIFAFAIKHLTLSAFANVLNFFFMEKSSSVLRLDFLETQTVIDSIFDALDVLHAKRDVALRSRSYDDCIKLDKRWDELHHVLDILIVHQKTLI